MSCTETSSLLHCPQCTEKLHTMHCTLVFTALSSSYLSLKLFSRTCLWILTESVDGRFAEVVFLLLGLGITIKIPVEIVKLLITISCNSRLSVELKYFSLAVSKDDTFLCKLKQYIHNKSVFCTFLSIFPSSFKTSQHLSVINNDTEYKHEPCKQGQEVWYLPWYEWENLGSNSAAFAIWFVFLLAK